VIASGDARVLGASPLTDLAFGHPGPVLQGLGDVRRGDLLFGGEIGDGAGQLEHPVVGARRESHLTHSRTEQRLGGIVEGGMLAQLLRPHVGVGQQGGAGEAPRLDLPRAGDALLNGRGGLTRPPIRELLVRDARHVEMDVDAVQQGATDPLLGEVVNWVLVVEGCLEWTACGD
jgi:hypothetical protein